MPLLERFSERLIIPFLRTATLYDLSFFGEKMARDGIPYILDQSTWRPDKTRSNNEALVDNWRPVAIVVSHEDSYEDGDMEMLEGFAEEYGLEIKRTKGMY